MSKQSPKVTKAQKQLHRLGEIASVMLDGEEVLRILEGSTMHYIKNPDPKHRYLALDHFVVDHEPFLRVKKTMRRLQMVIDAPCSTHLYLKIDGVDDVVTPLVQNGAWSRYYSFGAGQAEITPEMRECLETGEVVDAPVDHPSNTLVVLAPVTDSLGDVIGLLEIAGPNPVTNKMVPGYN